MRRPTGVPYSKPPLTHADQLQQLKNRGLIAKNDNKALHLLKNISYYRLSGYWYPLLANPKTAHNFKPGATFENAFKLYRFDRGLRLLILGELEKIEIAVRAKMIYNLWHNNGAFWYNDPSLFSNSQKFTSTISKLTSENQRSDEKFIKSFRRNYSDPLPPACMIIEISSFGNLSNIYSNLTPGRDKRDIANLFGLDESTFTSWLHSFTYVRNVCAHHSRLWNKVLGVSPQVPLNPLNTFITNTQLSHSNPNQPPVVNNRAYFLLSMIIYLLNTINPNHSFKNRLYRLFKEYPMIDTSAMGFPIGWENEELWNWHQIIKEEKWHNKMLKKLLLK